MLEKASKQVYTSLLQASFDYADDAWGEISEGCCKELPPAEPCSLNYITEEHLKWHVLCGKLVKSSLQKKNA